jgi:hypothetical protein
MTDERNITETAVDVDETVSRTYREIADECVPEQVNEAILAQSRKATRPRYARSRAWTRPLAWAATVALSAAVVLEVMQVPAPDSASFDVSTPESKQYEAVADAQHDVPLDVPEEEHPAALAPDRSSNFAEQLPEKSDLMRKTAAKPEPVFEERKREAGEIAEMQYNERSEATRMQGLALRSSIAHCPEEMMQDPSKWLECIEELDAAGYDDEASDQRRLLRETFPDFELP